MAKSSTARPLVLGGLALAAAAAGALKNRDRLNRLFGRGDDVPPPLPPPSEAEVGEAAASPAAAPPPAVANVDAPGPPANTSTAVPAPEPLVHDSAGGIDEAAEEAAAAAEAANIGGGVPEYPGRELGELAEDADRPLAESGGGEAEGQELAEFELADNAEPAAGDRIDGGLRIEDVIEAQSDPSAGEEPFDDQSSHGRPRAEAEQSAVGTTDPLEPPPPRSRPNAPGAMGGSTEGAAPTPPNPGATTSDAGAAQVPGGGGGGEPSGDEAAAPTEEMQAAGRPDAPAEPSSIPDTAAVDPTDPGLPQAPPPAPDTAVTGIPEPPAGGAAPDAAEPGQQDREDDGSEWQTWSGRAVDS